MKRFAITTLTALSIAFAPTTAPAQSNFEGQEVLGILLGLGALAAIAKEVRDRDEEREREKAREAALRAQAAQQAAAQQAAAARAAQRAQRVVPVYDEFRYDGWNDSQSRGPNVLPANCRRADVRLTNSRVLGARCLRRFDVQTRALPQQCRHRVDTLDGRSTVFGIRCLRQSGYQVAHLN